MILFKEPSVAGILRGEKTQARKPWARARAKEGAEHLVYRRPPMTGERPFAKLLITRVWMIANDKVRRRVFGMTLVLTLL